MNKLSADARARILHMLCEGNSMRAIERMTGVSKHTIAKLLNDAGAALGAYQDRVFRNLSCQRVQVDEIWSFTYAKAKNLPHAKSAPLDAGDTWTWTAIDADTKLVFAVLVGGRDAGFAAVFMADIHSRVSGRIQLTLDGWGAYPKSVAAAFGEEEDYAQLIKIYGPAPEGARRYSPASFVGANRTVVSGDPDMALVSTSYVERQNLTMRMHMRRFTRLTNGFSKKIEAHVNAIALHFAYYNFVRVHQTLRVSPAMAAGVEKTLWSMADLVAVVEAAEAKPGKRGPYKVKKVA